MLINEAFDAAKDAKKYREDKNLYRHEKLNELKTIKDKSYEREQTAEEEKRRAAQEETNELRRKLAEAEAKIKVEK